MLFIKLYRFSLVEFKGGLRALGGGPGRRASERSEGGDGALIIQQNLRSPLSTKVSAGVRSLTRGGATYLNLRPRRLALRRRYCVGEDASATHWKVICADSYVILRGNRESSEVARVRSQFC
ncbi:hypothetical protein EVAR_87655_1 [Eumeta japonica]|uniref:Uncharacterized protein n=1 Tax=Eumeta variegata TaxID=151549 RepID=A0A4C1WI47_EUMVA|nr:hypothetical protein EVAR_87655_1 [Eumeta japonica]